MTDCVSREDILDVREEIRDDAIEQFEIVHQELWYIDVTDCSKSYQLLQQSHDMSHVAIQCHQRVRITSK